MNEKTSTLKKVALPAIAGITALSLAACGGSGTSSGGGGGGDTVNLSVTTTIGGPDSFHNVPISDFLDEVSSATDGNVTYDFHYANSIVPPAEIGSAMADATVDTGLVITSYNPSEFPISNWLSQLGFAGESGAPAMALERAAATTNWWFEHPEAAQSDFVDKGLIPLTPGFNSITSYHLICTDPITSLADARGKSVRTGGQAWADIAQSIGMTPVSLPGAEMYEALQRGIVDCAMVAGADMVDSNLFEVAKHYTTMNLPGFTPYGIFISKKTWDKLDEETKDAIWDNLHVYMESLTVEGMKLESSLFDEPGMQFHEMEPDLAEAVAQYQDEVRTSAADKAPASLPDPQAAVDSFFALNEQWGDTVTNDLGVASESSWAAWFESGGNIEDIDIEGYGSRLTETMFTGNRPE
ncbi:TRAP transporter substrate-binding protein DctP [Dietzia kunjamensis]|uniref:TRAP transporter substrate-binding protein DctP n=1 Tax=Dietzia kunjamensis TaxID=322509 RepID=UPI002DBAA58A|nr:TRAP transporter substrate-binding protein DctP [Dietzia kunjamensis]MEB8326032.1 TRAP transporter substrate-binding protein DctP [Dietzia kunjamensis]